MNNVYVRDDNSLKKIVLVRMFFLIPLILYGLYKNSIYLYINKYASVNVCLKPVIILIGSILLSVLIEFIYNKLIKKNNDFIGFSLEYALLFASIVSINVNIILYFIVLAIGLITSLFINNKINIVAVMFLVIYLLTKNFNFLNIYESSSVFKYSFIDYLLGKGSGGIFSTHILLLIISLIGLYVTNKNKSRIVISSLVTMLIIFFVISLTTSASFNNLIFSNNYLFMLVYVAPDFKSSPYTNRKKILFGLIIGILITLLYFINPVLAPVIAIIIGNIINLFLEK